MARRTTASLLRWLSASGLFWLAATAGASEPGPGQAGDSHENASQIIAIELNRAEPVPKGCRLAFLIRNRTPRAFTSLQWDLVFFDADGLISGRMAAEAAPLPAGKTSVKLFDVPGLACDGLGRVLINDVMRCETKAAGDMPADCLQLTAPSSRAEIELIK